MLSKEFLSAALAAGMAVAPLQNCLGKSDNLDLVFRNAPQVQCAEGLTPLDFSKEQYSLILKTAVQRRKHHAETQRREDAKGKMPLFRQDYQNFKRG